MVDFRAVAAAEPWLTELAGAPRPPRSKDREAIGELDTDYAISRATDYLTNEAQEAQEGDAGDFTTYCVAARAIDYGLSEAMALELMLEHWNESKAHPPWAPEDLAKKVENAWRYRDSPAGVANPQAEFEPIPGAAPPALSADGELDDLTAPIEQRKWVIRRVALVAKVTELIAPPGMGKSSLALLLAVATATGRGDLVGFEVVRKGRVVVWNNEDDMNELRLRLRAIVQHFQIDPKDLRDEHGKPLIVLKSGEQEPLKVARRVVRGGKEEIVPGERVEEITQWLRDTGAVMLIADPLVELHDAAENDNGEMGAVGAILRGIAQQAGCATMVIHHTRKLPTGSSEGHAGNMDSGRGAGAIAGIARVALTLYGMSEKDAKHFGVDVDDRAWYVRLDSAKANLSAPTSGASWFRRVSVRVPVLADEFETETFVGADGHRFAFEEVGALEPTSLRTVEVERADDARVLSDLAGVLPEGERVAVADAVRRMGAGSPFYRFDSEGRDFRVFCERLERVVERGAVVDKCRIVTEREEKKKNGRKFFRRVGMDSEGSENLGK